MNFEAINPPSEALEHTRSKIEKSNRELSDMMPIEYQELVEMCEGDPMTEKAFSEMMRYAAAYMEDVWNMKQLYANKKQYEDQDWAELLAKSDSDRTRLHDTYIESIGIL